MNCAGETRTGGCRPNWRSKRSRFYPDPVYRGFGPTLATEYLQKLHLLAVSKETLRRWMIKAGPMESRPTASGGKYTSGDDDGVAVGNWCSGDTSDHDWLGGPRREDLT